MAAVVANPSRAGVSYVEWGAIFAGAFAAAALSFVLLTAGAAIGLSLVSPYPSQSYGKAAASVATAWILVVSIGSFLVGGYIAGRMRSAWGETNPEEIEFRDGLHGMLVWSLSIVFGAFLAFVSAATAAQVGTEVGKAALSSTDRASVLAPAVDRLLRGPGTTLAQATTPTGQPATTTTQPGQGRNISAGQPLPSDVRDEITRVFTTSIPAGQLNAADRQYLTQLVLQRTGLAPAEAEKRVDEAYAEAVRAVDTARKAAVLAGLVTATALLIGLAAAWYAAQRGGHHRDHNIPARFGFYRGIGGRSRYGEGDVLRRTPTGPRSAERDRSLED